MDPVAAGVTPLRQSRGAGRRGGWLVALAIVACVLLGAGGGFFGAYAYDRLKDAPPEGIDIEIPVIYQSVVRNAATGIQADGAMSVEETAAIIRQTVVEITTERERGRGWYGSVIREGAGSGVIITKDGYVATNYHVVEGASGITVHVPDDGAYRASVVGVDPDQDLAVLKIDASGLTPAVLGDSSKLMVGQTALAVGNPLGELGGTVTAGIISALDREMSVEGQSMVLLQTDAAINRGNSGGGLFNLYGELIGIINAKSVGSGIEGLGFAIPINTARKVVEDIISVGYVRGRVSAGLEVINIATSREAMQYRVNHTGLYVSSSRDGQLKAGDRIIGVNDAPVTDFASFRAELNKYSVGDTVSIVVMRGSERVAANITLTELRR